MNLRKILKEKNMMQKQIAQDLKIRTNTFNQYVTGKRQPDHETLLKIADYLDVKVDELLRSSESINNPAQNKKSAEPESGANIVQKAGNLPPPGSPGSGIAQRTGSPNNEKSRSGDPEREKLIAEFVKRLEKIDDIHLLKNLSDYSDFLVTQKKSSSGGIVKR